MKKFLINIAIFFAIVAAVDFSLGKVFYYLQSTAGGRTGAEYYACKKSSEDVIIMGSSRASHHYVPKIITEKTGLSCFNAGQDGNGIIMQYGRWKMLSERYIPKVLIYDINPSFDLTESDNMTYIDRLKPFSEDKTIMNYITSLFPIERLKLISYMYRYNYKFIEMTSDCMKNDDGTNNKGYIPFKGRIRDEIVNRQPEEKKTTMVIDSIKIHYLEDFIRDAKNQGVKVLLVVSPSWKGGKYTSGAFTVVKTLSERYNVPFMDYIDSDICYNPDNFEDSSHLNDKGAKVFTEDFISRIEI